MQCSKVFGYTLFSEYLINYAPLPNPNDSGRRARGVSDKKRRSYCTISSLSSQDFMTCFSHSQTSYFQHSYLSLQANRTGESYKKCTLHHANCRLTRFEHFLRDIEQAVYRHELAAPKDSFPKDFPWLTEHLIQQFYNNFMNFEEFLGLLLKLSNFSETNNLSAQKVCWEVYYREYHSVLQKLALVNEHSSEFIEQLFSIFTQLDRHISCEISPFLVKQFISWWIRESETNPDKHFELIEEWYQSADGQGSTIDFIEFLDLLYKLFFRPFPPTTRHFLLKDAYHSLVCRVLKKGYLAKCGPNNSKYQIRWMILYPERIEYFKRRSEEDMTKKGAIVLGDKTAVKNVYDDDKKGFYKFSVSCSASNRTFSIRADDIRIRMAWVTAIGQAVEVLNGRKGMQVFEKPLELTREDHDYLRTSSLSRGIDPSCLPEPRAALSSIPLPPPYNGALREDPLLSNDHIDPLTQAPSKLEFDPLASSFCRDNNRTLHIRHIDREFPDGVGFGSYESTCVSPTSASTSTDNDTIFRLKQFPSISSSDDEDSIPSLPLRMQAEQFPYSYLSPPPQGVTASSPAPAPAPTPAPRGLHKMNSSDEISSNRISMTTHPPYLVHQAMVVPPKIPPRAAPAPARPQPVVPLRSFPIAPNRGDSLIKRRY